jgi:hypothetical protein
MTRDDYSKRRQEDAEVLRQLEIRRLEKKIAELPSKDRREHKLIVGNRTFTLDEILNEAKEGTEYGRLYLNMQTRSRLERLRRK